jgi:hypothetical protein
MLLVRGLLGSVPEDKKARYEQAMLPHLNGLIKDLKELKAEKKRA